MRVNAAIAVALFLMVLCSGCETGPADEGSPATQIQTTAPPVTTPVIQTPTTFKPPVIATKTPANLRVNCKSRCVEDGFFSGICREECPEFYVPVKEGDECSPQELTCCCYYDECDRYCGRGIKGVCRNSRKSGWKDVKDEETNQWCQRVYNLARCYCSR